jgi:hypothetical protein
MHNKKLKAREAFPRCSIFNLSWSRQYIVLLVVATLLLIPRLGGFDYFVGKYLWAEDGIIFLGQAKSMGVSSIWEPYAGYVHLYPRLISLLSNIFSLENSPIIFLLGWFAAYLFFFSMLIKRACALGIQFFSILGMVMLISLQPNMGEIFFNITNSQWMLGAALCIWVLTMREDYRMSFISVAFLVLLGLTGPFSVILLPVLALKAYFLKDLRKNIAMYTVIFGCALVQLWFLLHSERTSGVEIDTHMLDWISSFLHIVFFSAMGKGEITAAILFWIILIACFFCYAEKGGWPASLKAVCILLIVAAALFIIAAQYAWKHNPLEIGVENRYAWIPYTLIVFAAMVATNFLKVKRIVQSVLFLLIGIVCYKHLHPAFYTNLQFSSFVHFSKYISGVKIPINPQGWALYYVDGNFFHDDPHLIVHSQDVRFARATVTGAKHIFSQGKMHLVSHMNDPIILIGEKLNCGNASDIGVEIDMQKPLDGYTKVFWSKDGTFTEQNSLKRWYFSGEIKAQFAFPYTKGGMYIRFDPTESEGDITIRSMKMYCLP